MTGLARVLPRTLLAGGFTEVAALRRGMERRNETGRPIERRAAPAPA